MVTITELSISFLWDGRRNFYLPSVSGVSGGFSQSVDVVGEDVSNQSAFSLPSHRFSTCCQLAGITCGYEFHCFLHKEDI